MNEETRLYIDGSRAVYHISLSFRGPQMNRYRLINEVSVYLFIFILLFFFCWLAAWGHSYRETPWRLNHFNVITLKQQQPIS